MKIETTANRNLVPAGKSPKHHLGPKSSCVYELQTQSSQRRQEMDGSRGHKRVTNGLLTSQYLKKQNTYFNTDTEVQDRERPAAGLSPFYLTGDRNITAD